MSSEVREHFERLVIYKAKRMKQKKGYDLYRQRLLRDLKVTKLDEAFLVGAFDAMIYDLAGAIGQAFMRPEFRTDLIKKILADS